MIDHPIDTSIMDDRAYNVDIIYQGSIDGIPTAGVNMVPVVKVQRMLSISHCCEQAKEP